mmetsp:Transcript_66918/g.178067  ORF Transcript_66918/g.178067 Transcript_66918/m.178067 type:complete len:285 (+) Transcript_66918:951-1805(+)
MDDLPKARIEAVAARVAGGREARDDRVVRHELVRRRQHASRAARVGDHRMQLDRDRRRRDVATARRRRVRREVGHVSLVRAGRRPPLVACGQVVERMQLNRDAREHLLRLGPRLRTFRVLKHPLGLEHVAAVLVQLEERRVQLHRQVPRLVVHRHHLRARAPVRHREEVGRVYARALGVDPRDLPRVVPLPTSQLRARHHRRLVGVVLVVVVDVEKLDRLLLAIGAHLPRRALLALPREARELDGGEHRHPREVVVYLVHLVGLLLLLVLLLVLGRLLTRDGHP